MVEVTPATQSDVSQIVKLAAIIFHYHPQQLLSIEQIRKSALTWIAKDHKTLVGFVIFQTTGRITDLILIATHPDWTRQGIASQLLQTFTNYTNTLHTEKNSVSFLTFQTRLSNIPMQKFGLKYGFENISTRIGFYDDPKEDGLIFLRRV